MRFKKYLLSAYRKKHNPKATPLLFGLPFTAGSICALYFAVTFFMKKQFLGGIGLCLVGILLFLVAYIFGWAIQVDYKKTLKIIKKEKYTLIRAVCISKTVNQKERYHDSDTTYPFGTLVFENNGVGYILTDWSDFSKIEPNTEYTLIFLRERGKIDVICDAVTYKCLYI